MQQEQEQHHLDINAYSIDEIFHLFKIPSKTNITMEQLKSAKKITLNTHPDKSKLPSHYFLFYKKAFEMVVECYDIQQKMNQVVPTDTEIKYEGLEIDLNEKEIAKQIKKVSEQKNFQQKFNAFFEENMREKPDPTKNEWFTNEEALFSDIGVVKSVSQMNASLEKIKEKTSALSIYKGVQLLNTGSGGSHLYDMDNTDEYITADPFSKLKYEDLRKVHKDQTVFSVSEKDMAKVTQYSSVDQYRKTRESTFAPLDKIEAETMLRNREKEMQETMMQKKYQSDLRSLAMAEKNKNAKAMFLRLR